MLSRRQKTKKRSVEMCSSTAIAATKTKDAPFPTISTRTITMETNPTCEYIRVCSPMRLADGGMKRTRGAFRSSQIAKTWPNQRAAVSLTLDSQVEKGSQCRISIIYPC